LQRNLDQLKIKLISLRDKLTALRTLQQETMKNSVTGNNLPKLANLWLQICLGSCIKLVYSSMITSQVFEWAEILEFTVNRYGTSSFGHFKESLTELFTNCTFEGTTYKTMQQLINKDIYSSLCLYIRSYKKAISPISSKEMFRCFVCDSVLAYHLITNNTRLNENNGIKIFKCGHTYHSRCLPASADSERYGTCPVCNPNSTSFGSGRLSSYRVHVSAPNIESRSNLSDDKITESKVSDDTKSPLNHLFLHKIEEAIELGRPNLESFDNTHIYALEEYHERYQHAIRQQHLLQKRHTHTVEKFNEIKESDVPNSDNTRIIEPVPSLLSNFSLLGSFFGDDKQQKSSRKKETANESNSIEKIDIVDKFEQFFD
jgi:hypothetical protein